MAILLTTAISLFFNFPPGITVTPPDTPMTPHEDDDLKNPLKDIPDDPFHGKPPPTGRFLYQRLGGNGIGHTMAEYNWGLVESFKHNLTKVHLPINCGHGLGYDCDLFFGVGADAVYTKEEIDLATRMGLLKRVRIQGSATPSKMAEAVAAHPEDNVVFNFTETTSTCDYTDSHDWWINHLARASQNPLWQEKFASPKYSKDAINVALHIRRGDLMSSFGVPGKEKIIRIRYTVNQFYIDVFRSIQHAFPPGVKVVGHFISEGEPADFQDIADTFPEHKILLHGGSLDDFLQLKEADVIVTAKSGYSHLAASFSDAVVIALPFWCPYSYLPSVVKANENLEGGFNIGDFVRVWNERPEGLRKGVKAVMPSVDSLPASLQPSPPPQKSVI